MATGKKIGYARVSTDEQHLDMQLTALKGCGCEAICFDKGISGARMDRPALKQALDLLGAGDTLVVWRLDRLGRSLTHLAKIMGNLNKRKVHVMSLTEYIDTQSSSGRFTFHMLAALAEFERGLISERTRAGMAAARERGSRIGRPKALTDVTIAELDNLLQDNSPAQVAEKLNVHQSTLRRYIRDDGESQ
ncbi:recombinase family protein [Burkholderia reimsis]|uniref:Recombinase family protein n=1 Tax=Burkholderia reimsis TaxID=2234132 RepID=A0A365QH35_9BURK|nr:recombinase family protein [Burkholderia reimsis]RBB32221.1 recombinase family protein [Burkholderia reimsis]